MSSRSIVDRVLLFAAAICAAGLLWQLTVLVTSKDHAPSARKLEAAAATPSDSVTATQPAAEATPTAAAAAPIRVVYADGSSQKMVGKATDTPEGTPVALASPAMMRSVTLPSAASAPVQPSSAPQAPASSIPSSAASYATAGAPPAIADAAGDTTASPADPDPAAVAPTPPDASRVAALAPTTPAKLPTDANPAPKQGLSLNHASIDALNRLPGAGRIGQAIASHRPYRSVEDLLTKRVVRRSVYDQIKHQLAAD